MPTKAATTATTPCIVSERLELAKAISNISSKADSFSNAMESFKTFSKDVLVKLDLDIEAKRLELEDLKKQIEHSIKNGKIDVDVALKEYQRAGAIAMLKDTNETVISTKELEMLRKDLKDLRDNYDGMIAQTKKDEAEKREKAISAAIKNMELQHSAKNATVLAQSEQREREIANLKAALQDAKLEIQSQRELTKSVAEASRHVNYMPHSQPQNVR